MPSDLSSYLASRYLVADPKPNSKKRKRKHTPSTGLLISDDSDPTWTQARTDRLEDENDDPTVVGSTTVERRSSKKTGWKRVGARSAAGAGASEKAAADAILAAAAAENEAARVHDDDAPVVEDEGVVKMSDGTYAGLQTAAAVSAQLKKRQREEQEEFDRYRKEAQEQETVYRDATGRRIDISMRRAELRKLAAEAELKERKAKEDLKGAVQLEEARARREKLQAAKYMTVARTAADEELNEELKARQRWNDPMAQFLPKEVARGKGRASKLKPVYKGAAPPNRYSIKPGYRWDGVDRGNGFEAKRFKAINRRERNRDLAYSWQMDE